MRSACISRVFCLDDFSFDLHFFAFRRLRVGLSGAGATYAKITWARFRFTCKHTCNVLKRQFCILCACFFLSGSAWKLGRVECTRQRHLWSPFPSFLLPPYFISVRSRYTVLSDEVIIHSTSSAWKSDLKERDRPENMRRAMAGHILLIDIHSNPI